MKFHSCFEIRRKILRDPEHIDIIRVGFLICNLYEELQEALNSREVFLKQKELYENIINQIRRSKIYSEILEEVGLWSENNNFPKTDRQAHNLSLLQNTNRELTNKEPENTEPYSLTGFPDKGKLTESDAYNGLTQSSSRDGTHRYHREETQQKSSRERYYKSQQNNHIISYKSLDSLREDYEEESDEVKDETPRTIEKENSPEISPEKKADKFYLFWRDRPYPPWKEMSKKSIKPSNFMSTKSKERSGRKLTFENE